MGFFAWIFYPIIWNIFIKGALILINAFQTVLEYITSDIIFDALFQGKHISIANIPAPFFIFGILSVVIIFMLFFIQYISLLFNDDLSFKERIVKSLKNSFLAGVFVIIMPIVFYGLAWTFSFFQKSILIAFGVEKNQLAQLLYYIGDPHWDGTITEIDDFTTPNNIANYNWITQILGTWSMMIIVVLLGIFIMKIFFELLVLFITGPIAAAMMVKDDGKIFRQWKDLVIGKVVIALASLIAFGVFILLMTLFLKLSVNNFSFLTRQLFLVILIIGGGFMVLEIPQAAGALVGHEVKTPRQWLKTSLPKLKHGLKHTLGFGNRNKFNNVATNASPQSNPIFSSIAQSQINRQRMTGIPGFLGKVKRTTMKGLSTTGALGKIKQQKAFNQIKNSNVVQKHLQKKYLKSQDKAFLINQLKDKASDKYQAKSNLKNEQNLMKWKRKSFTANKKLEKIERKK